MQVEWNPREKELVFWLRHDESTPDIAYYKSHFPGYDLTIMRSGTGDVEYLTAALLSANKTPPLPVNSPHLAEPSECENDNDIPDNCQGMTGFAGMDY